MRQPGTSRDNLKRNHPQLAEIVRSQRHKCADCGGSMVAFFCMEDGSKICSGCWSARIARRERAAREAAG